MVRMVETVTGSSSTSGLADAARLLHDFNVEYDEPAPPSDELTVRRKLQASVCCRYL
jgi:hypothetical protein